MSKREIPKIEIVNGALTISISAEDLQFVTENDPKTSYKVIDPEMFLNHFAAQLENPHSSNATELGISELQLLFDKVIEETYTGGSEAIIDTQSD